MVSSAAVWLCAATAAATTVAAAAASPTLLRMRLLPYAGDAVRVAVDVRNTLPLSVSVGVSWLGCCPLAGGGGGGGGSGFCAGALQTLNAAPASHAATSVRGGGGAARFEFELAAADLAAMAAASSGGGGRGRGRCVVAYDSAATGGGGGSGVPQEASFSFDAATLVTLRRAATDSAAPPRVSRNTSVSEVWSGSGGSGGTPPDPTTDAGCLAAYGPLRGHRGSSGCVSPPRRSVAATAAPPPSPPPVDTPVPGGSGTGVPVDYNSGGNALLDVLEDAVEPFVVQAPSCGGGNATWHAGAQRCVGCASGAACGLPGCACNARASGDAVAALGIRCNNGRFSYEHQACVCRAGWGNAADSVPRRRFCDVAQPPRVVTLPGARREAVLSHNPAVLLGQVWGAAPRRCVAVTALLLAACAVAAVAAVPALRLRFTRAFLGAMRDGGRLSHGAWQVMDQEVAAALAERRRRRRQGRPREDAAASSDDSGGDDDGALPPWQQATLQSEIPPDWSLEEHRAELRDDAAAAAAAAAAGTPQPSSDEDDDEGVAVNATEAGLPRYAADAAGRSGYMTELYSTAASIHTAWTSAPPTPMLGRIKGTEPINESELHRHPDASVVFDALPFVEDDSSPPTPPSSPEGNAETRRRGRRVRRTTERE